MNREAQKLVEKLNKVYVDRDELNQVCKDRLDFGFDSIYFRYATIRDELAYEKARYSHDIEGEKRRANTDKMHFYQCLEQLLHAHDPEDDK